MKSKSIQRRKKPIYGVGVNDLDAFTRGTKVYLVWKSMLARCYCDKFQETNQTYIGCSVCDEWKTLSNFKEWFDANYKEGYEIDKDILIKGNKVYSPETCRFIPRRLNKIFHKHVHESDGRCGVSHQYKAYIAECRVGKKRVRRSFDNLKDAANFYKGQRKAAIEKIAKQYLDRREIDIKLYNAIIYAVQ